jgi:hypothetical protein
MKRGGHQSSPHPPSLLPGDGHGCCGWCFPPHLRMPSPRCFSVKFSSAGQTGRGLGQAAYRRLPSPAWHPAGHAHVSRPTHQGTGRHRCCAPPVHYPSRNRLPGATQGEQSKVRRVDDDGRRGMGWGSTQRWGWTNRLVWVCSCVVNPCATDRHCLLCPQLRRAPGT